MIGPAGAWPGPGSAWTLATDTAFTTARYSHSSVVFNDRMWVIGGVDDSYILMSDVWSSEDGETWTEETGAASFSGRWGHSSVVFDGRMWVIGGLGDTAPSNDTWSSDDGITWTEETDAASFPARFGHTSVFFDDRIWVIGGYADDGTGTYSYRNDVWSSPDGITWTEETSAASFEPRNFHTSVVFDGRMWVIGGTSDTGDFNDVWSSTDGITWTEENNAAFSSARYGPGSVADEDGIWVIGGFGNSENLPEVWSSADGESWTEETDAAPFPGRNSLTAVISDDRIWVIGGLGDSGSLNDVWYSHLAAAPAVTGIMPESGINTGLVTITDLQGSEFVTGATVKLNRTGADDIDGTGVTVVSPEKITCTFDLTGASTGMYNIVVVNPDGQAGMLADGFTVTGSSPVITVIIPDTGMNTGTVDITKISGDNFEPGAVVVLNRTGFAGVVAENVTVVDPSTITCTLDLTGLSPGLYNVVVVNADGQQGMLSGAFTVTAPPQAVTTVIANTTIEGLTIANSGSLQTVTVDAGILPSAFIPNTSVLEIQPPADRGFQNITVYALDGTGFSRVGDTITGSVTGVRLESEVISPGGYPLLVGPQPSISYSIDLATYPEHAILTTKIWEGATGDDRSGFLRIAYGNDASYLGTAYTVKIIKTNITTVQRGTFHMSVNSSWNPSFHDGQSQVFIERISDDSSTGEVLRTRFLSYDPGNNLDSYEADSPRGLSTFGLSSLSGNNNPFQLIVLAVSSSISEGQEETRITETVTTVAITPTINVTKSSSPSAPPDTRTEKIYTNPDGVVTQATTIRSADGYETVAVARGVVARDRGGDPLSSITLTPVSSGGLPGSMPEGPFRFTGRACDLAPEGAVFSPAITVVFQAPPDVRFDQGYIVKRFDPEGGSWKDVPASFDPDSMTISAQVSQFSCIALFTRTITMEPSEKSTLQPRLEEETTAQPPSPSSAMEIFAGMMMWVADQFSRNNLLIIAALVVAIAFAILAVRRR